MSEPAFCHPLRAVTVEGIDYVLADARQRAQLDPLFASYFGARVTVDDLIAVFEIGDLRVDTLRLASRGTSLFETRATFSSSTDGVSGTFTNVWRRGEDGRLTRLSEGTLFVSGSRSRLALQLHADLAEFSRRTGLVDAMEVEARDIGRYAYRFMHGVEADAETRANVTRRLLEATPRYGFEHDESGLTALRSPRELCDHVILPRLSDPWMEEVDAIIARQGYRFSVDQVVDVARRPGLAFLIDQRAYRMRLNVEDEADFAQFRESVQLARGRRSLTRLSGVLGSSFSQLPRRVRAALLTCRPFLFPHPREVPAIPDLETMTQPSSPHRVTGFRTKDGVFLPAAEADPQGTRLRDYRAAEVKLAARAIRDGAQVVTVTGLSASGKTEILIWNLERALATAGHVVVSLDAQRLIRRDDVVELLDQIEEVLRPTVMIFDESVYLRGERKTVVTRYVERFLEWSGRHVVFVGGGRTSPQLQRASIEQELESLLAGRDSAHVSLFPKPLNLVQAYRFLGLARLDWIDDAAKRGLLRYILERFPPYFLPLLTIRPHERPEIRDLETARALIDQEVTPEEWSSLLGMVIE